MPADIRISPSGRLGLLSDFSGSGSGSLTTAQQAALAGEFESSSAHGLVALLSRDLPQVLPPSLMFWRQFCQSFFNRLCHYGENDPAKWREMPPPGAAEIQRLVDAAPPMPGLEYLTPSALVSLWCQLRELASKQGHSKRDAEAFLQSVNPLLHQLGRVTFHLAENKKHPDYPFAFMATYTNRVAKNTRLKHLPLGKAIQQYAGENNRDALMSLLAPVRRAAERNTLVRELLDSKAIFQPQAWSIEQAYRMLRAVPVLEDCGLVLRIPDWWKKGKSRRVIVQVQVGKKAAAQLGADSLLDFSTSLAIDGQDLTAAEVRELLAGDEALVLLRGQWVEVDRQKLQQTLDHWQRISDQHPDGMTFLDGMRLIAGVNMQDGVAGVDETTAEWQMVTAGSWLQDKLRQIRDPDRIVHCQPGKELKATLRAYQSDGVRWLWFLNHLGIGGCLADDMGLGKTIQVIALLLLLKQEATTAGRGKPSLLIVPASLVGNWRNELERFGPSLRVYYAHRSETTSDDLGQVANDPECLKRFDLVVTTYGLVRRWHWLTEVDWRLLVLDEAQAIKNAGSAQAKAVKKLPAEGRFALTGTPVENHLGDLWSLFDFCCPGLLGSARQFKSYVSTLQKQNTAGAFGPLRRLVHPYILRRLKTDPQVAPDLPEKTEMRCECSLSRKQAALYQRTVREFKESLESADDMARRGLVLSVLMQLKQICNHPAQFLGQGAFEAKQSGKMQRLDQLCQTIVERQEKALVFTQFRSITEPLANFLSSVFRHEGLVLHGGTSVKKRKQLVAEFQQDGGPPFFVMSLKAGGSGLNLTEASHVIHFDRWWNPAVENQATDRAFRIGQTKNVLAHKFVCRGTVEEKIDKMISEKQQLADELLDQGAETALTELSDEELVELVSLDLNRAAASE